MPVYKIYMLIYEMEKKWSQIRAAHDKLKRSPASRASIIAHWGLSDGEAAELPVLMASVKTSLKPMSDELKQFVAFTSGTSAGCAKVMSTH